MRLLISPAKKMREEDFLAPAGEPLFLHRAGRLLEALRAMPYPELKKLLACSDVIARQNYQRYQAMDLARAFTPALLAYEGIQYQYMAPGLFTQPQFDYVKEHLRILSGFYGLLRPLDPVAPYRLEMQARLAVDGCKNLYQFWGDALARGAGAGDGPGGQSGLPGVRQSGAAPFTAGDPVPHLRVRPKDRGQAGGKGCLREDGPGGDGALPGGAPGPVPGGDAGLRPPGLSLLPEGSDEDTYVFLQEGKP